jgi:hypothetical protein
MASKNRWTELALNPTETLEVELKGWLDLTSNEDKANVAQAALALANHGGGAILVGYEEAAGGWREAGAAPTAIASFTTDAVNGIVEKFADPSFHCELHIVEHERLRHPHPIIVVPGEQRVPVRAKREGPEGKHVKKDAYYIRRPGPQSAPPQSAVEWDQLIHRCVMSHRDDLLDNLRAALSGELARRTEPTLEERAARWEAESLQRFGVVLNQKVAGRTYQLGYFTSAYVFGDRPGIDSSRLLEQLRLTEHQTGWPVWIVFDKPPLAPYPMDGLVECHVWEADQAREPAHSDFWRASPEGQFFLLRGYQEDEPEKFNGNVQPGTTLDNTLPFWRVGECLLHATRMAERLGVPKTAVHMRMSWTGLTNRRLKSVAGRWPDYYDGPVSLQDSVRTHVTVDADRIRLQLADLVMALTRPLFEAFGFSSPQRRTIDASLAEMLKRTDG